MNIPDTVLNIVVKEIKKYINRNPLQGFEMNSKDILDDLKIDNILFEKLDSTYLIYEYISHIPEATIQKYESLDELEEEMCNDSGITNPFTTFMIPIVNNEAKDYSINVKVKNKWKVFDKQKQLDSDIIFAEEKYQDIVLIWKT